MQYAKPVTLNVEECDRLSFLPYLFGLDFLYAGASVYALAKKMMTEYEGVPGRKPGFFCDKFLRECHTNDRLSDCH